jgi:hypothetical protein
MVAMPSEDRAGPVGCVSCCTRGTGESPRRLAGWVLSHKPHALEVWGTVLRSRTVHAATADELMELDGGSCVAQGGE